jgi:hypothetical protein
MRLPPQFLHPKRPPNDKYSEALSPRKDEELFEKSPEAFPAS